MEAGSINTAITASKNALPIIFVFRVGKICFYS